MEHKIMIDMIDARGRKWTLILDLAGHMLWPVGRPAAEPLPVQAWKAAGIRATGVKVIEP